MKNSKNHIKLPLVGTYESVSKIREIEVPYGDFEETLKYLIQLVLFCPKGTIDREPDFGSELHSLAFVSDRSPEFVEDLLSKLLEDLNFWLGDYINVSSIDIRFEDDRLLVTVKYSILGDSSKKILRFSQTVI